MRSSGTIDIERAYEALDLTARLRDLPPRARVRGIWFKMTLDEIARQGRDVQAAFRAATGERRRWPFLLYDLREYLVETATAAVLMSPADPREGVRRIWRNAAGYSELVHPKTFIRLVRPDPKDALRWLIRHRDHFATFGAWRLEERTSHYAIVHVVDERVWIDSAHRGGAEGFLGLCGARGSVEVELDGRYEGRLHLRWSR